MQQEIKALVGGRLVKQTALEQARREWVAAIRDIPETEHEPAPSSMLEEDGFLPSVKAVSQIGLDTDRTFYTHRSAGPRLSLTAQAPHGQERHRAGAAL